MMKWLRELFRLEKKPIKGLMTFEWVVLIYLFATLVFVLLMHDRLPHADSMMWGRVKVLAITIAMWGVYRMTPCRFTRLTRAVVQMALLSWWYPDLFELNRIFPNLDHLFASWEQAAQPKQFERAVFIVIGSFFIHYVIFILLPVAGPQFYYEAVGTDKIAQGIFPNLHDYFNQHQVRMICPGYKDGIFYALVESAHQAGERPVAAFPSSHVGVTFVVMLLAWHFKLRKLFWALLPFAVLMFFSTVYIFAHYAIDALAGLLSGLLCWILLLTVSKGRKNR